MVLDIQLFRTEEGRKQIKASNQARFQSPELVDQVAELNDRVRTLRWEYSQVRQKIKQIQIQIGKLKRNKESVDDQLIIEKQELETQAKQLQTDEQENSQKMTDLLNSIGNLVHPSVPISQDEKDNQVVNQFKSTIVYPETIIPHHKLLEKIGGYHQMRGVKVIGHRGYFLTGIGVKLNMALQRYAMDFLDQRGYQYIQPPLMIKSDVMAKTAELEDFRETLYQIQNKKKNNDIESSYLIATSEQPISAFHMNETVIRKNLPIKYAGLSTCFRKEAGAHGQETWGIFRVHQFEKIEQFVLADPDHSWEQQEEMIKTAEEFYQSLGLSYRVVSIVSGALNNAAAKKYDLEAWFPSYGEYKELVSCSNCTNYQSLNLNIRLDGNPSDHKYPHLLNSTLCATQRTICCLLENYQTADGIIVPEKLRPYLNGLELIPYLT